VVVEKPEQNALVRNACGRTGCEREEKTFPTRHGLVHWRVRRVDKEDKDKELSMEVGGIRKLSTVFWEPSPCRWRGRFFLVISAAHS
jgi:hypothetical protein